MAFVTYADQRAMEKGVAMGMEKALLRALDIFLRFKFGNDGVDLMALLRQQTDVKVLDRVLVAMETAASVEELRQLLPPPEAKDS